MRFVPSKSRMVVAACFMQDSCVNLSTCQTDTAAGATSNVGNVTSPVDDVAQISRNLIHAPSPKATANQLQGWVLGGVASQVRFITCVPVGHVLR